jgi:hypothetical protein
MNCGEARSVLAGGHDMHPSAIEQAGAHMRECPACRAALAALADDVARPLQSCAVVQELLPVCVSDAQTGSTLEQRYPGVWRHLRTCDDCLDAYRELQYLLHLLRSRDEAAPASAQQPSVPAARLPLSFDKALDWVMETGRDLRGRLSASIVIRKAFIAEALSGQTPAWARSAAVPALPQARVPLADAFYDESSWLVSVALLRDSSEAAPSWHLLVTVLSSEGAGRREVRAGDEHEERVAVTDGEGTALFRQIPASWIREAGDAPLLRVVVSEHEP